jgi:hypothetical protein
VPERTGRRTAERVVGVAVAIIVVVALGSYAVSNFSLGFDLQTSRKHLKPIPIAASACPYVRVMHATANALQSAEPFFGLYLDRLGNAIEPQPPWPQVRARVRSTLLNLQLAIFVSTPHFPPPIRHHLTDTLNAIHTGLIEVGQAQDAFDLVTRSSNTLSGGQTAFGYASDLVGRQCHVPLGANSPVGQPPTTTPAST